MGKFLASKKTIREDTNVKDRIFLLTSGCVILSVSVTIVRVSDDSMFRHIRRKSSTALRLSLNLKRVLISATTSERCSKS